MPPISKRLRGRQIRQKLPDPPPQYDQIYLAQLADAVNDYMVQATAPAEVLAARFICVDPIHIPGDVPDQSTLPTGMLYLTAPNGTTADSTVYGQAWATSNLTLTTAAQNIPGCSLSLTRAGVWLIIAAFDFIVANEQNNYLFGQVSGSTHQATSGIGNNTGRMTVSNQGIITVTAPPQTVQLQAYKGGGTGNSSTGPDTGLSAVWIAGAPTTAGNGQFFTIVTPQDPQI